MCIIRFFSILFNFNNGFLNKFEVSFLYVKV